MVTGKYLLLVLMLSGYILSHSHDGMKTHKCVHDTKFKGVEKKIMEEISEEEHKRILQIGSGAGLTGQSTGGATTLSPTAPAQPAGPPVNDGWHQMRIFVDYTYSNKLIGSNPSLNARYEMSIRLVESVRNYFQNALQVNFLPIMRFTGGTCYNNKIPPYERPIDLFVTIYPENDSSTDYFAAATPCYLSARDGRPTVGAYILNFAFLKATPLNEYLYFSTFAHEFTHILGFSNDLFEGYVDSSGAKRGLANVVTTMKIGAEQFTAIKLPEVVNYARNFFNCPSITAVPLENNGGDGSAGSHWEKLFLPQEYMNPTVENPGTISEFTMALLRGTGWYQVAAGAAQPYDWGQNSGCGHFQICPTGPGYCTANQVSQSICSSEWISKGTCTQDRTFSSGCFVKRSKEHTCLLANTFQQAASEYYGPGARCINYMSGSTANAKCHRVQCTATALQIMVGSQTVTCDQSGKQITIPGETIPLVCPDLNDFCSELKKQCPNDCNGQGICLNGGKCQCGAGFSGADCSTKTAINYAAITSGFAGNAKLVVLGLMTLFSVLFNL